MPRTARGTAASQEPAKETRRGLRFRLPYLLVILAMALFAYKFLEKTQQIHRLQAEQTALQRQNDQMQQDSARILRNIKWYQRPQYVREAARSILGYTMPGDVVIQAQLVRAPVPVMRAAPPPPPAPPEAVWRQWWHSFFG
jgi:cell division protein FtsB